MDRSGSLTYVTMKYFAKKKKTCPRIIRDDWFFNQPIEGFLELLFGKEESLFSTNSAWEDIVTSEWLCIKIDSINWGQSPELAIKSQGLLEWKGLLACFQSVCVYSGFLNCGNRLIQAIVIKLGQPICTEINNMGWYRKFFWGRPRLSWGTSGAH